MVWLEASKSNMNSAHYLLGYVQGIWKQLAKEVQEDSESIR